MPNPEECLLHHQAPCLGRWHRDQALLARGRLVQAQSSWEWRDIKRHIGGEGLYGF